MDDLKLYHGSPEKFDQFEIQRGHSNGSEMGYGIYLTDDEDRAKMYAGNEENPGMLYQVNLSDEALQSKPLSDEEITLSAYDVSKIYIGVAQRQIDQEGYPYILSDHDEPSSETEMDAGNKIIAQAAAEQLIGNSTDDVDIINGVAQELGQVDLAAADLNPVLNDMGIHYATHHREYEGVKSIEYVVFNPADAQIEKTTDLSQQRQEDKIMDQQQNQNVAGTTQNNQGKEFTQADKEAYAAEMQQREGIYKSNVETVTEGVFQNNEAFEDYVTKTRNFGHFSTANQMQLYAAGVNAETVATRRQWNKIGFYPKNKDAVAYLRVPKTEKDANGNFRPQTYKDDKGVEHRSMGLEPVFTEDAFKKIEYTTSDGRSGVSDKSKAAIFKYNQQTQKNAFGTARDVRYKAYDAGRQKLNHDFEMNPHAALQTAAAEYQARRGLKITKNDKPFSLENDFKGKVNVAAIKAEERFNFLKEINTNSHSISQYAERRLGNAPKVDYNKNGKNASQAPEEGKAASQAPIQQKGAKPQNPNLTGQTQAPNAGQNPQMGQQPPVGQQPAAPIAPSFGR